MSAETITTVVAAVVIIGFLWSLHRDVRSISERVARLEGQVNVLASQMQTVMQALIDRERGRTAP